jgi:uncharacterized protein (DUF433 family)
MQLEDYFDFQNPNGIRIKGTRVSIEHVIYAAGEGLTAGQIRQEFPSLTLEQVHACLTYYYGHRAEVDAYMAKQEAEWEQDMKRQEQSERPEVVKRLLQMRQPIRSCWCLPKRISTAC